MATTRRGKGWQASVRIDGRELTKTFPKKADADRWVSDQRTARDRGEALDVRGGRTTFGAYAESWRKIQRHREGTARGVEHQLRLHVVPTLGARPLAAIRTSEIQALVTALGRELAPGTVGVIYTRVAAIFHAAVRDHLIASTPCDRIALPKSLTPRAVEVLTAEQVHAIAEEITPRYRAVVIAGAGLGLRPGELGGLNATDVDFLRHAVKVTHQLVRHPGRGVELAALKTLSSYRTVPLPDVVADALAEHLATYGRHPMLDLVFTTTEGGPMHERALGGAFARALERAKISTAATPHSLRHFYASVLIDSGASVKVVQSRLGHASAKTTLDTYGHLFPSSTDETRGAIDAALARGSADVSRTSKA